MKIKTIWVVTNPNKISTLEDICFEVTMGQLSRQFLGGLRPEEILATFTDGEEAFKYARKAMELVSRYSKSLEKI